MQQTTLDVLAERIGNFHTEIRADLKEIKTDVKELNGQGRENALDIVALKAKQGLITKIILGVLGSGSLVGGGAAVALKLLG